MCPHAPDTICPVRVFFGAVFPEIRRVLLTEGEKADIM